MVFEMNTLSLSSIYFASSRALTMLIL